ncbi:MAG: hypothetical protein ACLQAH_10300 [Limisphaerales bacterium]
MKTKHFLVFALFITITALLSGCGKPDAALVSENADLKARLQKLEQQLQASKSQMAAPAAQPAASPDLQSQLDEAQKKADAAVTELQSANSLVETQKQQIDQLTRALSDAQQAREKAEKALQLYQDKTAAAIREFQALRSILGDQTNGFDAYPQHYQATQTTVTKVLDALPESRVRRQIVGVLATFTHINNAWVTAGQLMQARTQEARADYDKFLAVDGIGTNDYSLKMGKDRILAPAEQDNAAMASVRDEKIVASEKDLDLGIKNLLALVNGPKT